MSETSEKYRLQMFEVKIAIAAITSILLVFIQLPFYIDFIIYLAFGIIIPIPIFIYLLKFPQEIVPLRKMIGGAIYSYTLIFLLIQITFNYWILP